MRVYVGIDLHSNNNVIAMLDENDKVIFQKRLRNDLKFILRQLGPYKKKIEGIVVESTYNWYWLVDGLMEAGYGVHLANTSAIKQYEGLKYTDDKSDARFLAHLLRLGILPEGYIYPKEERAVRDLLRKRSQLVRQRTSNIISVMNLAIRNTGYKMTGDLAKWLTPERIDPELYGELQAMAIKSNVVLINCLTKQISIIEKEVLQRARLRPEYTKLLTVDGIGQTLGLTIMLETGDIRRFPKVGNFSSYCRCVGSQKLSNGKVKGRGNRKNGNKYLAWAFGEAAVFCIRHNALAQRFYQRKLSKTNKFVAMKAVAHKLARACYYIMRDQVPFDATKAFA